MPAVTTSSPTVTVSLESIWRITSTPAPSWPMTSPVAAVADSWPMTLNSPSVSRTTLALSGPTSVTRPASARPATIATSPTAIPSLRAPVEDDEPAELGRLTGDDGGRHRLVLETGLELEEAGQHLVLAAGRLVPGVLDPEPLVLHEQRGVVDPQAIDLGDGAGHRGDPGRHVVDRPLDRPEREAHAVLDLADRRVRGERHHHRADHEERRERDAPASCGAGGEEGGHRLDRLADRA